MKRNACHAILSVSVVFLSILMFAIGCQRSPPLSEAEKILAGEHALRKMGEHVGTDSKVSTSFFLIAGGTDATANTSVAVNFFWKMNDGTYAGSSLPLGKIRIKPDENATTPTVKFCWLPCYRNCSVHNLMEYHVVYAQVTVRESDWPTKIQLPLN